MGEFTLGRFLHRREERKHFQDIFSTTLLLVTLSAFTTAVSAQNYEFQIVGGGNFGVLKIKSGGDWYNVCPDVFDSKAAELVCKELGYSYLCTKRGLDVHDTESSSEPILSTQPQCGRSVDIIDCQWENISLPSSCFNRTRHTILSCANETDVEIRLTGGAIQSEGVPQIRCSPNDSWSFICGGRHWDIRDCRVFCQQLGYKTCAGWRDDKGWNNQTDVNTIFTNSYCGITEKNILECSGDRDSPCDLEEDGVGWLTCGHDVDISGTETTLCGSEHTCTGRCGDWQKQGGCQCDQHCHRFNDCCVDYEPLCKNSTTEWSHTFPFPGYYFPPENYSCVLTGEGNFVEEVQVIDSCTDPLTGSSTARLCEEPYNMTDIFSSLPVHTSDGVLFKNIFCALCNRMSLEEVTPWDVVLYYRTDSSLLTYDPVFEKYVPSGQFYLPRSTSSMRPRTCSSNLQNTCNENYVNSTYGRNCGQYYAPIIFKDYFDRPTYQSPDCRNCEGFARNLDPPFEAGYCVTSNYRCHSFGEIPCRLFAPLRLIPDAFVSLNFKYTDLDRFERNSGTNCEEDEVYDPFLGVCRILECPLFFSHVGSKCVPSEAPIGQQMEVRLTGADGESGRVEVRHLYQWYSACGEFFNANVSNVLCRQLGFDQVCTSTVGRLPRFPALSDQEPYTIGLRCTGFESSIDECEKFFTFDNVTTCNPRESEVFVTCANSRDVEMKLVGSTIDSEGFLQLKCNSGGDWAYVHGSTLHWDSREGQIVCRNLGYNTFAFADRRPNTIEKGAFPVVEREIYCVDDSFDLLSCPFRLVSPDEDKYAWVSCGYRMNVFGDDLLLCGSEHTCRGRCGSWQNGCSCDVLCGYFNDCCVDFSTYCNDYTNEGNRFTPFSTTIEHDRYRCKDIITVEWQVVSLCSPFWTKDQIKANCEIESAITDVMSHTPVYDKDGVVYYNIYCAICNDASPDEVTSFPFLLKDQRNNPVTSIHEDTNGSLHFAGVGLPTDMSVQPRSCILKDAACSDEKAPHCQAYYAPIFTHNLVRNPSCINCRELDFNYCSRETCDSNLGDEPCLKGERRSTIFDLFDFAIGGDSSRASCENVGEVFDPFLETCRFVGCPKGFYYSGGVCEVGQLPYNSPQIVLAKMVSESIECVNSLVAINANEITSLYVSGIKKNASATGPFGVTVIAESLLASFSVKITLDSLLLSASGRVDVFYRCGTATFLLKVGSTSSNDTKESCNGDEISFSHTPDFTSETTSFRNLFSYEFSPKHNGFIRNDLSDVCWNALNPHLGCLYTSILNPGQFDLTASRDSIRILLNDVVVTTDEFQMLRNGSLRVCSDKVRVTSKIYEIAYTVCIVISLVAMLLTFITYQTFPKLRNVPGLCLMNLLAALFVANFIFLFNDDFTALPEVCVGMAALSHYTWLASFAWMSVLSYNMARTFGTHSMQLNTSSDTKTRLMKYSLYAWGLPFLVMTFGLALHFCDCTDGFVFRYGGRDTCWITDGLALFFSVGVPVAVMLTFDLAVFLYTGVSLRRSRNAVKRVRINAGSSNDLLIELAVNTRLFILLGITWIFGFVQYLWPVTLWKVVFLVSNSLQGLFIFIMFVMKKRVLKMWLDLFSTCRIEEQTPTTKAIEDIPKPSNVPAIISQL